MKAIIFSLVCLLSAEMAFAQSRESVEESLFGLQAGLAGVWINYETRLSDVCTMRSEIEFTGAYARTSIYLGLNSSYSSESYAFVPLFRAEPRWYYNLKRRASKGKNTLHNAANYLSVKTTLNPGFAIISKNLKVEPSLSIIPEWGLRRNFSKHFNFELSGGVGYSYTKSYGSNLGIDLSVRFGYVF